MSTQTMSGRFARARSTGGTSMTSLLRELVGPEAGTSGLDSEDTSKLIQVFANDIQPDTTAAEAVGKAVNEMGFCKDTFDDWSKQMAQASKARKHEPAIFDAIDRLRDQAFDSWTASGELLKTHDSFSRHMERVLKATANHDTGTMNTEHVKELLAMGERIQQCSQDLDKAAVELKDKLTHVLELVEDLQRRDAKRKLRLKYMGYLQKAFCVLAILLAAAALIAGIVFAFPATVPVIGATIVVATLGTGATMASAASKFFRDMKSKQPDENFEKMLHFLKQELPEEKQRVEQSLDRFREHQRVLQINTHMKQGLCVRMTRNDALLARDQWKRHRAAIIAAAQGYEIQA